MSSFGLTNGESQGAGLPVGLTNGRWGGGLGIMLGKKSLFFVSPFGVRNYTLHCLT